MKQLDVLDDWLCKGDECVCVCVCVYVCVCVNAEMTVKKSCIANMDRFSICSSCFSSHDVSCRYPNFV